MEIIICMKSVVFDMDGVLFDSEQLDHECWLQRAQELSLDDIDSVFYKTIGRTMEATYRLLKDRYGEDFDGEGFIKLTLGLFDERVEKEGMPLKPYAKECLESLKAGGYRIGLASSTKIDRVTRQLKDTGLYDFFDDIVGGGMFEKGKPDPEAFMLACHNLDVNPSETYIIEDSFNGIRAAYNGGMKPVMVPDLLMPDDEIRSMCHCVLKDLREVAELLCK